MSHTAFILATAGHVDHGKSSLVRALTGTDPDRLPEEKARGMTIDLGFAHLLLTSEQASDVQFDIGIVDVPGHEDFVRNMVAGVGSIDAALLVVGADDGWMPQTEEHLQILTYFGVCHGVVALTKADLAIDLVSVERSVRERLRETPLSDANIIRTSVKDGRGLDDLRRSLSRTFAAMVPPTDVSKPRLAIDRAFSLRGVGTVVTGSLAGGRFRRGDEVILQSSGTRTRIRTLQTHGKDVDEAIPGMRVAINLPDVSPASGSTREDAVVRRGDVVTVPHVGVPVRTIDVLLERSPRAGPDRLRSGAVVRIHVGSCSIPARVRLLDAAELNASQCALARITFRSSVFILTGERFVLRDWSEQHTLAGGVVLDVIPPGKRRREAQLIMLKTRSDSPDSPESFAISQVVRDGVCERKSILRQSVFAEFRIAGGIDAACKAGTLVAAGEIVAESGVWADLLTQARGAVDAFHQSYPERPGIPLTEINRLVTRRVSAESAYDAVIHALTAEGFRRDATVLRRTSHRPALPPRLELAGGRIRVALARRDLDAPTRHQIAPDDLSMQALKFLIANGEAVEIGMDQVLSSDAYAKATSLVRQHIQQHGPSTVSELKSALGSSRRVMVPLIEKLDREGVTRRQGDTRTLR